MSTQQYQQPLNPLAESLITCHNLEHPRSVTHRIKACLTLGRRRGCRARSGVNQSRGD